MAVNITMPALSPTMEEGNLAKWFIKVGDTVSAGDVIAEIETDKATMEIEAVDEGIVAKILVDEGSEGVKVNSPIAIIAEEGEDIASVKIEETAVAADVPEKVPEDIKPETPTSSSPVVAVTQPSDEKSERIISSPLARRVAKENNIQLSSINGSGPRGRVILRDIETAIAGGNSGQLASEQTATELQPAPLAPSDEEILRVFEDGKYDLVPHDNMRKVIARRLVQSKQTIPHFYLTVECQLDALLQLRSDINSAAPLGEDEKPDFKISVNDFIIKAMGLALRDVPDANVSWTSANMVHHKQADVGVAVSIPGGLITPVVRNVQQKTLSEISNEMKYLTARARNRKLLPHEYQGGSTAVSNLGMFGIREFSAVINPPQATILAVGAGEKRPVVTNGELGIATVMSATLSTDHRAVDGVLGSKLLGAFKRYIEIPVAMLI